MRRADINAALERTGEPLTGTSLMEMKRSKYNPATQMPYTTEEILRLVQPNWPPETTTSSQQQTQNAASNIEQMRSLVSRSINSSAEDDYDGSLTNALCSVQGNFDDVSVINVTNKPYLNRDALHEKIARATPKDEPTRNLESLTQRMTPLRHDTTTQPAEQVQRKTVTKGETFDQRVMDNFGYLPHPGREPIQPV